MPDQERKIIAERYEVISEIGSGGMAVVYKARDTSLKKYVAVKMLRPEVMTGEAMMRFQLEAKMASTLLHPNLIRTLDFGITSDAQPYLVMDYVDGITLSDFINEKTRVPIELAAGIFIQICDAMSLAHGQGVLHRDLKSSNVLLTQTDTQSPKAFVVDFGLAKRVEDPSVTRAGQLIGSPQYMSPEHARGDELDMRADIYSMGCIMFETLTGRAPIIGETVLDTIMRQTKEEPPSLAAACPAVEFSAQVESIVATSLKKDPNQRFQSMDELKISLQALREYKSAQSTTREMKLLEPATVMVAPLPLAPAISRRFVFGCIALLLIVGGVGLLVAPVVPMWIDAIHPNTETEPVTPIPSPTDSMISGDDAPILPGSKLWSPMQWSDGITWYKKFDILDDDLTDFTKLHKFAYLSLDSENPSSRKLVLLQKAELKGLSLSDCLAIGDTEMKIVGRMKSLEVLHIDKAKKLSDEGFRALFGLENLKIISMQSCRFSDEGFNGLERLRNLEVLYLSRMPNFHGAGVKYLQKLPDLKKLRIDRMRMKPGSFAQIAKLKNLRVLSLEGCRPGINDIKELSKLPRLEVLDVANTALSEDGFSALIGMKSLKKLYVGEKLSENLVSQTFLDNAQKNTSVAIYKRNSPKIDNFLNYKYGK